MKIRIGSESTCICDGKSSFEDELQVRKHLEEISD